eukprot:4446760-Prymnesium_polylepis.1
MLFKLCAREEGGGACGAPPRSPGCVSVWRAAPAASDSTGVATFRTEKISRPDASLRSLQGSDNPFVSA